jgi:hypothetical protein
VDQGQFSDPDFISGTHQMENVQFADKIKKILKSLAWLDLQIICCTFIKVHLS